MIQWIDSDVDEAFFNVSVKSGRFDIAARDQFKIVFTALHGTSITAVPQVLEKAGYKEVHLVEEQSNPTVTSVRSNLQTQKNLKPWKWL